MIATFLQLHDAIAILDFSDPLRKIKNNRVGSRGQRDDQSDNPIREKKKKKIDHTSARKKKWNHFNKYSRRSVSVCTGLRYDIGRVLLWKMGRIPRQINLQIKIKQTKLTEQV